MGDRSLPFDEQQLTAALVALDDEPLGRAGDEVGDDRVHGDPPPRDRDPRLAGRDEPRLDAPRPRRPPADLNVPTGANLTIPAKIVLTVGSDCAIGKMTVSLELERAARARGIEARFVPTGQTGIAIAGWGIAVDAVVSDFIAGAAERLVVEGHERGGELLLVEGQGAVTHPAYSGVTLGLIHGSAPHLFVLCHLAGETEVEGYPGHPLLSLPELVDLHERISLPARKAKVAAVALNTRLLEEDDARAAIAAAEAETGLVADDVVRFGPERVIDSLLAALYKQEQA